MENSSSNSSLLIINNAWLWDQKVQNWRDFKIIKGAGLVLRPTTVQHSAVRTSFFYDLVWKTICFKHYFCYFILFYCFDLIWYDYCCHYSWLSNKGTCIYLIRSSEVKFLIDGNKKFSYNFCSPPSSFDKLFFTLFHWFLSFSCLDLQSLIKQLLFQVWWFLIQLQQPSPENKSSNFWSLKVVLFDLHMSVVMVPTS